MPRFPSSLRQSSSDRNTLVLVLLSILFSAVLYHCWFIENLTLADDTAQLPKEPDCRRYVEHTKNKWGITLPHLNILGFEIGGGGFEIEPEVLEAAGREALILDIAQHYYCEEMNRAIENENVKLYRDMEKRRQETMKRLVSLTEQKTGKELKEYVSQNYEPIKSMAVGKGSGDAMVELDRAYVAASPSLVVHGDVVAGTQEVGIEIKGGEIHAGRDVIGIQKVDKSVYIETETETAKIELSDEQLAKAIEIIQKNLQTVNTEELTAKIKALEEEIGTEKAKNAEALVVAANKALELGKKNVEDRVFEKAVNEFNEALSYLPKLSEAAGDVYINLAAAYAYLYQWDMALDAYTKAEKIGKELNKKPLLALAYGGTGTIYHSISKYDQAIEYYKQSLDIRREVGDRRGEGITLNNISSIYKAWGKYGQALEYYKQSLGIFRDVKDKKSEGVTLNNIGSIYDSWGKYGQATEYYEKSLAIKREVGDRRGEGITLNNIGEIYRAWGKYGQAIEYYKQDLAITREVGDRRGEGVTLFNIATIYEKQGRIQEAVDNLEEVVKIDEVTKNPNLAQDRAYLERLKGTLKKQHSQ